MDQVPCLAGLAPGATWVGVGIFVLSTVVSDGNQEVDTVVAPSTTAAPTSVPDTTSPAATQPRTRETPTTSAARGTAGKFEQTWPKSYGETTCGEWESAMTVDQQRVAAADMLVGAQSRDGGNSLPSDSLIEAFRRDISVACEAEATLTINEIAAGVYVIGRDQYRP